ncbi:hypothetical protein RN001_000625 [Aquatica leii]|uniref:Uncharacterized protein n=1 Tax=Aquatica leii TaxID=1421715 RepID=A0AAN7SKP5_9COLE|nr:hypothetical protein RN001_000625 [Aquatica leii]
MRVASALWTRGNPKEPVPFQELLPLKLRNSVSGKGDKTTEQSLCSKEIESFQKCYKDHTVRKSLKEAQEAKGILIPGEKKLSHKQLNKLLSMFPNIK